MSQKGSCPHWCEKNRRYQTNWTLHPMNDGGTNRSLKLKEPKSVHNSLMQVHTSRSCQLLAGWGDIYMFTKWRYVGTSLGISRVCCTCICTGKNPKTNFTFLKRGAEKKTPCSFIQLANIYPRSWKGY